MSAPALPAHHPEPRIPFAGIATRAVALVVDAAAVTVAFWLATGVVALVLSLFSAIDLQSTGPVLGVLGSWGFFVAAYFVLCWTASGQTLGMHLMRIRVVTGAGKSPPFSRACLRMVAFTLGAIPLFAGHLMVLVQSRRRALHDLIGGTFVVYEGQELLVASRAAAASSGELVAASEAPATAAPTRPAPS